ncbi:MAG: LapA family protein [Gammaproteobacteria bacterium]|nr:LapA family protein [Gammaproteobacteria bacterium]MDA7967844.1 LapA family protein [Gammaproteobacteria bacterium]MDA7989759.1 LapA family protein [Gammaproteobacteria bacterium]MDA7994729.1 LapA family protein [Gammaproteobacteria bacterium]MDA8021904.1 LapA family protein [Gammaproteobacteria bacterium]
MKRLFYVAFAALVALFGITFAYKNHQAVSIRYYFGVHFDADLALLLFAVFALSLLAGYAAASLRGLGDRRQLAKIKRELRIAQTLPTRPARTLPEAPGAAPGE